MTVATLGGGGSVTGTVTTGDLTTEAITVLTTPATADYAYEIDIQCYPTRASGAIGLLWAADGFATGDGVVTGQYQGGAAADSGPPVAPNAVGEFKPNRIKLKVGPSTPVTVMYQNEGAATPTYRIAYNYIGYKIT